MQLGYVDGFVRRAADSAQYETDAQSARPLKQALRHGFIALVGRREKPATCFQEQYRKTKERKARRFGNHLRS
jgi:hypothetical protein